MQRNRTEQSPRVPHNRSFNCFEQLKLATSGRRDVQCEYISGLKTRSAYHALLLDRNLADWFKEKGTKRPTRSVLESHLSFDEAGVAERREIVEDSAVMTATSLGPSHEIRYRGDVNLETEDTWCSYGDPDYPEIGLI